MTTAMVSGPVAMAAALPDAVQALTESRLSALSDEEFLEVMRLAERAERNMAALNAALVARAQQRGLPGKGVHRSRAHFLSGLLNLSHSEALARVRHAGYLGPRLTMTGDPLDPLLPVAADARLAGTLTARQVDVVIRTLRRLESRNQVTPDDVALAEKFLVEQTSIFDATTLAGVAKQLIDTLDPDGTLADEEAQHRRRHLSIVDAGDGMHRITGDLDAETAAVAMTVLHSLATPKPSGTGAKIEPDPRSPGQRMHDAFKALLQLALRAGELPRSGGVPATVIVAMTADQFETKTGLASTSVGQKVTVSQALRVAGEASIAWVVHNSKGGILNYGRTRRIASESQTIALIARDKGCTFPGCTDPPEWTERHHITPWAQGGATNLDNLCLLCDFHHDRIDTGGWTIAMRDGVPWLTPPEWIDPDRTPQRNVRP